MATHRVTMALRRQRSGADGGRHGVHMSPRASPVATTGGYRGPPTLRPRRSLQALYQDFCMETMGLEPTTPCLQSTGTGFTGA